MFYRFYHILKIGLRSFNERLRKLCANVGAYQRSVPKERTKGAYPLERSPKKDNPIPLECTTSLDPLHADALAPHNAFCVQHTFLLRKYIIHCERFIYLFSSPVELKKEVHYLAERHMSYKSSIPLYK